MAEGAGWRLNRLARGVKLSAAGGEAACGLIVDAWNVGLSIIQMPLGAFLLLAPADCPVGQSARQWQSALPDCSFGGIAEAEWGKCKQINFR